MMTTFYLGRRNEDYKEYLCEVNDFEGFDEDYGNNIVTFDNEQVIDPLNRRKSRNEDNCSYVDYNCFGYATNTFVWGLMFEFDFENAEEVSKEMNRENDKEYYKQMELAISRGSYNDPLILGVMLHRLKKNLPNLRPISTIEDLKDEDEYGIAFACGVTDFHFAKILPDRTILHKPGSRCIREEKSLKDVFGEKYNSEVFLFANK